MKRPGKPEGPHYLSHQAVDGDYGIIVGQTVTSGDVNDSVPYLDLMEQIHTNIVPIQIATADAAYDFPLAHRALGELGIGFFVRPQKTAARVSVQFTRDDFRYDEGCNVYRCPGGKELRLVSTVVFSARVTVITPLLLRDRALVPGFTSSSLPASSFSTSSMTSVFTR